MRAWLKKLALIYAVTIGLVLVVALLLPREVLAGIRRGELRSAVLAILGPDDLGLISASGATTSQPSDADLTTLAAISGVRGDIIYYGASGWTRLAKGTATHILTEGANDPAWAAPAAAVEADTLDSVMDRGSAGSSAAQVSIEATGAGNDVTLTAADDVIVTATDDFTVDADNFDVSAVGLVTVAGNVVPNTDSARDLGSDSVRFAGAHTDYTAHQALVTSTNPTTIAAFGPELVILDTAGSTVEADLPALAAAVDGRRYVFKRVGANTATIDPSGSETIDGSATSYSLGTNYQSLTIFKANGEWNIE